MKKTISLVLALCLLLGLSALGASASESGEPVQLTYWVTLESSGASVMSSMDALSLSIYTSLET